MCLDMTLLLFDHDMSLQTRQELATELNRLFQNSVNRGYVLDVLLCSPLPQIADTTGVVGVVENSSITREVVTSILDCQERVRLIFESWQLVKQNAIVQQNGIEQTYTLLSWNGVFRRLALEATDRAKLNALKPSLAMDENLTNQLETAPRIVVEIANELSKKLPVGKARQSGVNGQAVSDVSESEWQGYDSAKPQHSFAYDALNAALSQVGKITDLYTQLKDTQANSILDELIAEQRLHSNGEQHIVKSLCNIATQVNARGRPEISFNCLNKALDFPNGIDSQLYLQIGKGLRGLGKFDEAVRCYDRAEQLDNGLLSERILLERIRKRVAIGNYEEACSDYLAMIPDLQVKPPALSGLGTLYRKMGRPREAYRSCLRIDGEFYTVYAGLAEIRKQTGKPHQAIAEYNALIRRFTDLDVGPKKVYQLARSHLFRLTRQYDKSEEILRDLADTYPADRDVHLQFAKLLTLRGDYDREPKCFEKANGQSLQNLGQLIFAKASKNLIPRLYAKDLRTFKLHSCLKTKDSQVV